MRFTIFAFGGKEGYLRQCLLEAGHSETEAVDGRITTDFDLIVLDCDWPWAYPRPHIIQASKQFGAKVALYPHAGRPTVWVYDGIAEPMEEVDLRLEHGRGSIEMAESFTDFDLKQQAPGWLYSPTLDFTPKEKPRKILFAPLHANIEALTRGYLNGHDPAPALNQPLYKQLLDLKNIQLRVSVSGPLWRTGLWAHPRAEIIQNQFMRFEQSLNLIDWADVVIAAGTMAATAVARGKPTVMFDQDTYMDYVDGEYVEAAHASEHQQRARYPIDTADGALWDLITKAVEGEQTEWRERWVGTDGAGEAVKLLEGLVDRPTATAESGSVTIQGATARATSG